MLGIKRFLFLSHVIKVSGQKDRVDDIFSMSKVIDTVLKAQ